MYWQQPKNFDDCILKHTSGTTNKEAAQLIYLSCRKKFPERPIVSRRSRDLNPSELSRVTGRAGLSFGNYYSGTLYNGNDKLTVTHVEVVVTTSIDKQPSSRSYIADVTIPPKTTTDFGFNIIVGDPRAEYNWQLASARGFEE
jgi:hypothetical protein